MCHFPKKVKRLTACIIMGLFILLSSGRAQQTVSPQLPEFNKNSTITPFFEKDETVGSPYLSRSWVTGTIELYNHKKLPEDGQPLLFNFDKTSNLVYIVNKENKIKRYPVDSILGFSTVVESQPYTFEKVTWISDNFFLLPMIRSEKGYSLYKRLLTRFLQADFSSEGYYTKGRKFDEYVDYYEYYILYPGHSQFRKLYLREKDIRKGLREESKLLDEFFSLHDNEITEQILIGIIQYIDDKKFPE